MDNSLAALLKLTQQQSGASSPFECLVASLQEKENKLAQLTKDLKELQEEFQTNYDIIIRRDSKIEEMKGMYEAKDSEYKVISARAKQSQDEINLANERISILQGKIDELMKNKSSIDKEITQIQFNTIRLKETKLPVMQIPESKDSLDKLNATLSDLIKRKDMVYNIVTDIYNQSTFSCNEARSKNSREIEVTRMKKQDLEKSHQDLVNAIHQVEQQTQDELSRIDIQKQQIDDKYGNSDEYRIHITQMKKAISEIDSQINILNDQQKEYQETDLQRKEFFQNQAQRLSNIAQEQQEKCSSYKVAIHTQKMEIKKLQDRLSAQQEKNEEIRNTFDKIECGYQKPNFKQILFDEKEKLNKKFAVCSKRQLKAQQKIKDQQHNLEDQIENQKQVISRLAEGINHIVIESRKRTDLVTRERKKSKLISLEIKSLEEELKELGKHREEPSIKIPLPELPELPEIPSFHSKEDHIISRPGVNPPPPLQIPGGSPRKEPSARKPPVKDNSSKIMQLTQHLEEITNNMNDAKTEMQNLKMQEASLLKERDELRIENIRLRQETDSYDEIQKYYVSMQKIGSISLPNLPKKKKA